MANMIWQVGETNDEAACATGLSAKNGAPVSQTRTLAGFDSLGPRDRLQIVANLDSRAGTAGTMTPTQMADFMIAFDLRQAAHISLVICDSALPLATLAGLTFSEALRRALIAAAVQEGCSLHVGTITGRLGFVNVYTQVLQSSGIDVLVRQHFIGTGRTPEVGRKYVHTEPTVLAPENQFLAKGSNKTCTQGIAIEEGIAVA